MSLKERLTRTLSAVGTPRENVAAVGMAQSVSHHLRQVENAQRAVKQAALVTLGMRTMALKYANRSDIYQDAVERLSQELLGPLKYIDEAERTEIARDLARAALQEHVIDMCPTCKSSGEIPDCDQKEGMQPMKMCPTCAGTGGRAYSEAERALSLDQDINGKVVRYGFRAAIEIIQQAEKMAREHWIQVLK